MKSQRHRPNVHQPRLFDIWDERQLLATCMALGAQSVDGWSLEERQLVEALVPAEREFVSCVQRDIRAGMDPLGEIFCTLRSAATRRLMGATYTPLPIVGAISTWARAYGTPDRIVDPGCGSARFLIEAGSCYRNARLIGVEVDPVAAILARGNLAAAGLASRSSVCLGDYRVAPLPKIDGRTLFLGNPPYVRHHLLPIHWKEWLANTAAQYGCSASQLAGLHVYFFLATLQKSRPGDFGAFITSAEWLDVNYGSLVRELFLKHLGGTSITVIDPKALPFPDAATTGAITCFHVGSKPETITLTHVDDLAALSTPGICRTIRRERLETERRWSHLARRARNTPSDFVELGELCRVHRGTATGANKVWIAGEHSSCLPQSVLFPTVTRAKEILTAGLVLSDASSLRRVIDLPEDLDALEVTVRRAVEQFLKVARTLGADTGYIARTRRAWWSVRLRDAAPILATYMARRPPAFVRNIAEARHINIAHGLYPREILSEGVLRGLVTYLSQSTDVRDGRTYAGGLTKFEPREMERILVPRPHVLEASVS